MFFTDSLKPKPPVIKVNPLKFQTKPPFYIRVTDNTPVTLRCSSNTLHVPGDIQALWYELNCVADVRYQVTNVYHEITAETTVKTNGKYVCQIRNGIETIEALTVVEFDGFSKFCILFLFILSIYLFIFWLHWPHLLT